MGAIYLSQGCEAASLYSPDSFEVPDGFSLPYFTALATNTDAVNPNVDPYASTTQSRNLRVIEICNKPELQSEERYVMELNADYTVFPSPR